MIYAKMAKVLFYETLILVGVLHFLKQDFPGMTTTQQFWLWGWGTVMYTFGVINETYRAKNKTNKTEHHKATSWMG